MTAVHQDAIEFAYDDLMKAVSNHGQAVTELIEAKRAYESRKAELISAGVEGKNADQRDAALALAMLKESQAVMIAEDAERQAKLMYTLADLERSKLRMIIQNEGVSE